VSFTRRVLPIILWALALLIAASSFFEGAAAQAAPQAAGQYALQSGSVCGEGSSYQFRWLDASARTHEAQIRTSQVVTDDRNYLEVTANQQYVLHLRADESVPACRINNSYDGNRQNPTTYVPIPIPIGGPTYGGPSSNPAPSSSSSSSGSSSGRQDTLAKPSQSSAPNATGGFNFGTGGGTGATNKSSGSSSGLSGGSGSGSGATNKSSSSSSAPKAPSVGGGKSSGGRK
jgi:hypothetical protein